MLCKFACFLSSMDFLLKLTFSKKSFRNTIRVSNSLDPHQARRVAFVCVEVLRPSQPNGVMLSAVSLPNHTFTGQA